MGLPQQTPHVEAPAQDAASTNGIMKQQEIPLPMNPKMFHDGTTTNGVNGSLRIKKYSSIQETMFRSSNFRKSSNWSTYHEHEPTFDGFLDIIAEERLNSMPHDGSHWDKTLRWAVSFATRVQEYRLALEEIVGKREESAELLWTSCISLLQMGEGNHKTLMRLFYVLHDIGVTLSTVLRHKVMFRLSPRIQNELLEAYLEVVMLTSDMNMHLRNSRREVDSELDQHVKQHQSRFYSLVKRILIGMWDAQSIFVQTSQVDMIQLREFLKFGDSTVSRLVATSSSHASRAEFTCEWFNRHLSHFSRSKTPVMLVTGAAGTGKSVLSHWIVEQLQDTTRSTHFSTLMYSVRKNIKATTSTFSLIKNLLLQVLDSEVGNSNLLRHLRDAFHLAEEGKPISAIEDVLWQAFDHTAEDTSEKTVIVVDGLDGLAGGEKAAVEVMDRLHHLAQNKRFKVIALSRPLSKSLKHKTQHFSIEADHIRDDIRTFVESHLSSDNRLRHMSEADKSSVADRIAHEAKGSFTLADLMCRSLTREKTTSDILKGLDHVPKNVEEAFKRQLALLDFKDQETRVIFLSLLASERPLSLQELRLLLEIDVNKCMHLPRLADTEDEVRRACGSLVLIRDGMVSLRYHGIHQHLLSHLALDVKAVHSEFVLRCLTYVRIVLHKHSEAQFEVLDKESIRAAFAKHHLLEYTVRHWSVHFSSSDMYHGLEKKSLSSRFKACFPSSAWLALLEGSCFEAHHCFVEYASFQYNAMIIRKQLLGEMSISYLQSLITRMRLLQKADPSKCVDVAYEAWHICVKLEYSSLAVICAEVYFELTYTLSFSVSKEVLIRRRTIIEFLIKISRSSRGASHTLTLRYVKFMAQLYVAIGELQLAAATYRELFEICIERYGYLHEETVSVYEILTSQLTVLSKLDVVLELAIRYQEELIRSLTIDDERCYSATMTVVRMLEQRKEIQRAEVILVSYWRSVTTTTTTSVTARETRIQITLEYSKFLQRVSRHEESKTILKGLYTEIQSYHEETYTETLVKYMKQVAVEMKSVGIVSAARSIFNSMCSWFKKTEQQTSEESVEVATMFAETITETISSETTSTTTTETAMTTKEEQTLKEILETSLSVSKSTEITSTTRKIVTALASSYIKQERWEETIEIYSKVVKRDWTSKEVTITTKTEVSIEEVETAIQLATCYFKMLQVQKAELIYLNLVHVAVSATIDVAVIIKLARQSIEFFEKIYRFDQVITIYRQVTKVLVAKLGKGHTTVVDILYQFGSLAVRLHRHEVAQEAYLEIYMGCGFHHGCCTERSLEAARFLCGYYEHHEKWEAARDVYRCLWITFLQRGQEYKLQATFAEEVYQKYMHFLEETKSEYTVIKQTATEYRKTCISIYGSHSEQTMRATMHLAEICERSETHIEESISLYEEVVKYQSTQKSSTTTTKTTTTTTSSTTLTKVKKQLAHLYSKKTETSSKSISIYEEEYKSCISKYGYTSKETMTWMKELVVSYRKQSTKESITKATQVLSSTTYKAFESSSSSEVLIESAKSIAKVYLECEMKETAVSVLQELRQKAIYETETTSINETSWMFIVAFEETISLSRSFSVLMAELKLEFILYQSYRQAVKTQVDFLRIIQCGAQLIEFQKNVKRQVMLARIHAECFEIFSKKLQIVKTINVAIAEAFFQICLRASVEEHAETTIVRLIKEKVYVCFQEFKYQDAYELVLLVDRFMHAHGGFHQERTILDGFVLCLYLVGRRIKNRAEGDKFKDLREKMSALSRQLLQELLKYAQVIDLDFSDLAIDDLNELVDLLGHQHNDEDLVYILEKLWRSRKVHKTWSPHTVIYIGRRLVEALFSRGKTHEAIHICRDMRYNLTRVWGVLDPTTLEITNLLWALYTETHQHKRAMALTEEVLSELAHGDSGSLRSLDNAPLVAAHHIDYLKRSYQRLGGFEKEEHTYRDLFDCVYGKFGSDDEWKAKKVQPIDKWSPKGAADSWGCWKRPENFTFLVEEKEGRPAKNMLRQSSSSWLASRAVNGNGVSNGNGVNGH